MFAQNLAKMKIFSMRAMVFLLPTFVLAQEIVPVSKADALQKVASQNSRLKVGEQEVLASKGDYNQTNAVFLPNISVSYLAMATTNPLMAFGFKLNQEIVTPSDFNPDQLNNPSQINMFATKLEVQQPIINIDGIYQRKAARAKWEATRMQLQRSQDYLFLETEKVYMQLQLAYKSIEVLETALKASEENLRLAQNSFNQGYLQHSDVLNISVHKTEVENQLQNGKSNVRNLSEYLLLLMDDDRNVILQPSDSLTISSEITTFKKISESRGDIKALEFATEAYQHNYRADKMAFLPKLNAFGSYELYDDEIFHGGANGYLFGAALTWNVLEGSKRFGKMQKSRAEYQKAAIEMEHYKSESQWELNKAQRDYSDAKNRLRLTESALEQSEEALRIRLNRFKEGLERTTDLLMSESQYAQKQMEYYQTIFQHNYALAYLHFLTKE